MMIDWIPADERLPFDGAGVVAAVTGRYPAEPGADPVTGPEFWIVLPMYFRDVHPVEETGEVVLNCFVDSDRVLRRPPGGGTDEVVTHWAYWPNLPGTDVRKIVGEGVGPALRAVSDQ